MAAVGQITFAHKNFVGGSMSFVVCYDHFRTGYKGEMDVKNTFLAHPIFFMWKKGQFKDVNLELDLAVGSQPNIKSASDLRAIVENFYRAAIGEEVSPRSGVARLPTMSIQIGSWYFREFFVLDVDSDFLYPWDINTGEAMRCKVALSMLPFFTTDYTKLPKPKTFSFSTR